MKILFFVHSFPCVSETFVLNQVTGLIDEGHDVRTYYWGTPDSCIHQDFVTYNLKDYTWPLVHAIPQNKFKRLWGALPIIYKGLKRSGFKVFKLLSSKYGRMATNFGLLYISERLLDNTDWTPDIVISHFGHNGILINALKSAGVINENVQLYTFFHAHELCTYSIDQIKTVYRAMLNSTDYLLPISRYWENKLLKAGASKQYLQVFHMGIDPTKFTYNDKIEKTDTVNILSVGRLVGQKGYEYAIKGVADYIKKTSRTVRYVIIGRGELENELKLITKKYDIEKNVTFLGAQPQEAVTKYMKESHIFLLPSVKDDNGYMEGIPVALMEAMAMGLVCISTYHSGIPELITDKVCGFLCEERNSKEISDSLSIIENLPSLKIAQIKATAREKVLKDFNIKRLIPELSELLIKNYHLR